MATAGTIKIKLSANEMEALALAYRHAVAQMELEQKTEKYTLHETLLLEHAQQLSAKLDRLHEKGQVKYTLTLTSLEAMAVYQLWQRPFGLTTYSGNAVRKVYGAIDERHKSMMWVM